MRYVNQKQYPDIPYITRTSHEGEAYALGQKTTIASSGCGLCSAIMVLDRLLPSYNFELEDAIALSYEVNANYNIGTSPERFFPAFVKKFGLRYENTANQEDLRRCLRTGGVGILHVRANQTEYKAMFTKGGHYMVAVGEEADGRIAILDPSYVPGKYSQGEAGDQVEIVRDVVVLCPGDILEKEIGHHRPCYHMFWRE